MAVDDSTNPSRRPQKHQKKTTEHRAVSEPLALISELELKCKRLYGSITAIQLSIPDVLQNLAALELLLRSQKQ
jgi:hypothetical protein